MPAKLVHDILIARKRKVLFRTLPGIVFFSLVETAAYLFSMLKVKPKNDRVV